LLTERASRREVLLDAAVVLFARDGFQQVTMEDIGAAVGMAGPSIYHHFSGKPEILDAAITRGTEWLQFLVTQVLSSARTTEEASATLLRSYTAFVLPHSALIDVLLSETHHLPEERRHATRRAQREFVDDWIGLLRHDRPDQDPRELRAVVLAELTIINNIARTQHLAGEPETLDDLVSICSTVQRKLP
jgi:AcrR family transcriptional regulator